MSSKLKIVKVKKEQLEKAVHNVNYVKHQIARKYATNASNAQGHIGVISAVDDDLKVLTDMLVNHDYLGGEEELALIQEAETEDTPDEVNSEKESEPKEEETKKPGRPKKTD